MSDIVIVSGARTPMGGFQGSLSSALPWSWELLPSARPWPVPVSSLPTCRK